MTEFHQKKHRHFFGFFSAGDSVDRRWSHGYLGEVLQELLLMEGQVCKGYIIFCPQFSSSFWLSDIQHMKSISDVGATGVPEYYLQGHEVNLQKHRKGINIIIPQYTYIVFSIDIRFAMPARSRRQKTTQLEHAFVLVNRLAKRLTSPQHQHRMQTTNQLIPLGSLKRRCVREIFQGWVHKAFRGTGRVLTKKLVALVVRRLRLKLELPDCYDISSEVSRLQYLLKVARKRLKPKPKTKHMSNVDNMDTLLQVFDDEHPTPAEMGVVNPEDCTLPNVGEGI